MAQIIKTFQELVDNAPDIIARFDRELRHIYVNPAVESATGIPAARFIGKTNEEMGMPAELCSFWAERMNKVITTGRPDKFEFDFPVPDGMKFYQSYIVPEFSADGSVETILTIARDVTEHRQAEHDLRKTLDELDMRIQEKTAKLEEANKKLSIEIDERIKTEMALRKSEEDYHKIYVNAMVGIFQSTPEGKYLRVNPALAAIHGFSSSDEMIYTVTNIGEQLYVNPEDRKRYMGLLKKNDLIRNFEAQLYRKDWSMVWISMNVQVIRHPDGSVAYYEGIVENITSRKQAEEALQERDIQFKKLSFWVPGMIYRFTKRPDGTYCMPFTTEAIKDIFGCSPQDVRDDFSPIAKVILPEDLDKVAESIEYSAKHLNVWKCEYRVKIPGQPIRWLSGISTPEKLSDGSIIWYGFNTDITERKKAEEKLNESEEKYRSIFENAVEGIFQSTPEGRLLSINPSFARMTGYASPEEMIESITDLRFQAYVNPGDREQFVRLIAEHGIVEGYEIQHYRKDGSIIWVSINARCVYDDNGVLIYYEGTFEDITKRKLAEEELQNTMEKLRKSLAGTIQIVSMTVETRDPYTAGHQRRVANLARTIAQEMGLSSNTVDNIRMAGIIHDIGKISIPAELLAKPTKLTNIEFSLIQVHPQTGYDIIKDVGLPYPVAEIVLQHHERLDGSGYPQGLKGDQILLEAKIISVADVVEAIATHRPYRPARGIEPALDEIEKNIGILYDEKAVDVCLRLFREKGFAFE
jgi:PAS domain S-box-containing protein